MLISNSRYYYNTDAWDWQEYEGSDDTATNIALPETGNGATPVYNLSGQKVNTSGKDGLYIVGGKKVIVK